MYRVPLVPLFPVPVLPSNGINGALMLVPRH
jgi:hypothetical protein